MQNSESRKRKRGTPKQIDSHVALGDAIHRATKPDTKGLRRRDVDEEILKDIKSLLKKDSNLVQNAYRYLVELLKREHAQVRLLAFQIFAEIFQRSKVFRGLAVKDLKFLMEHAVGTNPRRPLPSPDRLAELLRERALEHFDQWGQKHAARYPELRAACRYLTHKKLLLPHIQMHTIQAEAEEQRRSETTQRLLRVKYQQALREIPEILSEIKDSIEQMEQCFELLIPDMGLDDPVPQETAGEGDDEQVKEDSLLQDPATPSCKDSKMPASLVADDLKQHHSKYAEEEEEEDYGIDWESGFVDQGGRNSQVSSPVGSRVSSPAASAVSSPRVRQRETSSDIISQEPGIANSMSNEAMENFVADSGLGSMSYQLELEIPNILDGAFNDKDMEPVLFTLKDNYKLFVSKYKPLVEDWINTLSKVELTNSSERNRLLTEVLEQKACIQNLLKKCSVISQKLQSI